MAKPFAYKFYKSTARKKTRAAYIGKRRSIDGGLCEHCKDRKGYIVDHITELTEFNIDNPMISLSQDNFQYLCLECHNTKTFSKHKPTRGGTKFTEDGEIVEIPTFE